MELFGDPEFWVFLAFLVFLALAGKKGWGLITRALDSRAAAIKGELDRAVQLREEAQALLAGYQRQQRDAVKETAAIIEQAKHMAEIEQQRTKADFEAALERQSRAATEKIAQAEAQALADIRDEAVEITIAATRAVIASSLDEARADALIDEAIAGLETRLAN